MAKCENLEATAVTLNFQRKRVVQKPNSNVCFLLEIQRRELCVMSFELVNSLLFSTLVPLD